MKSSLGNNPSSTLLLPCHIGKKKKKKVLTSSNNMAKVNKHSSSCFQMLLILLAVPTPLPFLSQKWKHYHLRGNTTQQFLSKFQCYRVMSIKWESTLFPVTLTEDKSWAAWWSYTTRKAGGVRETCEEGHAYFSALDLHQGLRRDLERDTCKDTWEMCTRDM